MSRGAPPVPPVDRQRDVQGFIIAGSALVLLVGLIGPVVADIPFYPVRILSFVVFGMSGYLGLRTGRPRAGTSMLLIFTWWWALPLVDLMVDADLGYGSRTTMGILLMMTIIVLPSVVGRNMRVLSGGLAFMVGAWGLITGVAGGATAIDVIDQSAGLALGGLLGHAVMGRYMERVARSNLWQRAVADCSQALLTKPGDEAVARALDAITSFLPASLAFADLSSIATGGKRRLLLSGIPLPEWRVLLEPSSSPETWPKRT